MLEASLGTFPFPIMAHGRALRERLTEAFPELDEQTFIIAQEHVVALVEKHLSGSLQQQRSFAKEPSGLAAGRRFRRPQETRDTGGLVSFWCILP